MRLQILEWQGCMPLVLPLFDGLIPAGFPSPAEDYVEVPLDLNEFLVPNKPATFLMRVHGTSMQGAGILDGDLLVVDRAANPISGNVVVVALNGEYTVKRLRRTAEGVWLEPANPQFRPTRIASDEELHVFGVVKHSIHTLR